VTLKRNMIVIAVLTSMTPVLAETLTCSDWQGIRTCQDSHGYVSHETTWNGITTGDDNRGGRWSSSRQRDNETTTITPLER
jgi:hypothetical protein